MDPAVGLLRSLPIIQPGKAPGMLQGVLIVEDFTAPHKHLAPVPDPLGSIPHNHYHGVSRVQPAQLAQLRIQAREDGVGIPQATPQKATRRMASGRGFHTLAGQQQHPGFDLLEWALLHRWQGRKRLGTRAPPALLTHLHAQHAAIHTQHHGWRSLPSGGTFPATVGMVSAHPFAITGLSARTSERRWRFRLPPGTVQRPARFYQRQWLWFACQLLLLTAALGGSN